MSDFYLIDEFMTNDYSLDHIAGKMGITRNALYKALNRRKLYNSISGPSQSIKLCSISDIHKIADDLRINKNIGILNVLNQINISRINTNLPRIVLC